MLRNYLSIALRQLYKHPGYTALNVAGLTFGVAAALLIGLYVTYQFSYDDFHRDADRIYRIRHDLYRDGALIQAVSTTVPAVGPAMLEDFPEVEVFARIIERFGGGVVRYEDRVFREHRVYHADASFFDLFSYPMLLGDPRTALVDPNTVVLSTEAAHKYFGAENPLGRHIRFNNTEEYLVTGVAASPENSHFTFDVLFSYPSLVQVWGETAYTSWTWYDFRTYVRLRSGTDPAQIEARFPEFITRHREVASNERIVLSLQPLQSIHLHSDLLFEARANGSAATVYALAAIGIFILMLAWVNYLNLATARALERAREIGVRKAIGAQKGQLVGQFLFEVLVLNIGAGLGAVGLTTLALPVFNRLAGVPLHLELETSFWLAFSGMFVVGALLSGLYPAFFLSSFRPVLVLKGRFGHLGQGLRLRQGLVVFQFTVSAALITGTLIVAQQLDYMQRQDLGVEVEQTLVVRTPTIMPGDSLIVQRLESFKEALQGDPRLRHAALSSEVPGTSEPWVNTASRIGAADEARVTVYVIAVDFDYLDGHGPRPLAGRFFGEDHPADRTESVVLNETAVRLLGFESPEAAVRGHVRLRGDTLAVVGVVADHHQQGLDEVRYQLAYQMVPEELRYLSVRLDAADTPAALASLENAYRGFFPDQPFDYTFLDQYFAAQYRAYRQFGHVFGLFAVLAVFIACLGLFGLSAFAATQRTKEIGVRKVLGASVESLLLLLSRDFMKLVLVGSLFAAPVAWIAMEQWLAGFAYRITPSPFVFIASLGVTTLIALATVGYHAWRTATADPVKSLRYE